MPISIGYNMTNLLRVGGLASGMNTDAVVKQLMQAESIPLVQMQQKQQILEWQRDDYRSINTAISALRDMAFNMELQSSYLKYKATTTPSSGTGTPSVSAIPGATALEGSYTIDVTKLAAPASLVSAQKLSMQSTDTITVPVDFTISVTQVDSNGNPILDSNGKILTKSVTVSNASNAMTINDVIAQINGANIGVTASYDNTLGRFVLTSQGTGSNAGITATDNNNTTFLSSTLMLGTQGVPLNTTVYGVDAQYVYTNNQINSSASLTSHTNTAVINGTTYTFQSTGSTNITIQKDTDAIYNTIKGFIDKYNETISTIYKMYTEPKYPDYLPLTDDQKQQLSDTQQQQWTDKAKSGLLQGDDILGGIMDNMRKIMGSVVNDSSMKYRSLSDIGITTYGWGEDPVKMMSGELKIDDAKLRDAINNNLSDVMKLFTKAFPDPDPVTKQVDKSQGGIMTQLNDYLSNTAMDILKQQAGTDSFDTDSFLTRQINDYNDQILEKQRQLQDIENRYYQEFSQMEAAMNQMNAQSAWLAQQFGGGAH